MVEKRVQTFFSFSYRKPGNFRKFSILKFTIVLWYMEKYYGIEINHDARIFARNARISIYHVFRFRRFLMGFFFTVPYVVTK